MTTKTPILNNIRIIPREQDFLDRKVGSRGEVFFDQEQNTLRLYDGELPGGYDLAKADLTNIPNNTFKTKANAAGISASTTLSDVVPPAPNSGELWLDTSTGLLFVYYNDGNSSQWIQPATSLYGGGSGGGNTFATVAVSGQSSVVADSAGDVLTLVAGSNVTITTDPTTDSIVISAPGVSGGGGGNSFTTISVAGQGNVIADNSADTLVLANGAGIAITTDSVSDTVTIASTVNSFSNIAVSGQNNIVADSVSDTLTIIAGAGIALTTNSTTDTLTIASSLASSVNFSGLIDSQAAGASIDKVYMPAITMLTVTNSGNSAYLFDQYSGNNPTIYALSGTTIAFNLNSSAHPFLIQDGTGTNYNTGLVHVSTTGELTTGSAAQGKGSGTLYWKIPINVSGGYRYQCQVHGVMVGSITIKSFVAI